MLPAAKWQISLGSATGRSHLVKNIGNQDHGHYESRLGGGIICAALSDGAGSAVHSAYGSKCATMRMTRDIADALVGIANISEGVVREVVEKAIETVRKELAQTGRSLVEFHCTIVAWIFVKGRGFIAQIGDSIAVASHATETTDGARDPFPLQHTQVFGVDRGEYVNETFFLTGADWKAHCRIAEVSRHTDVIVLMTDGAMEIAMHKNTVYPGFLPKILQLLRALPDEARRNRLIEEWLAHQETYRITGDDKTMLIASKICLGNRPCAPVAPQEITKVTHTPRPSAAELPPKTPAMVANINPAATAAKTPRKGVLSPDLRARIVPYASFAMLVFLVAHSLLTQFESAKQVQLERTLKKAVDVLAANRAQSVMKSQPPLAVAVQSPGRQTDPAIAINIEHGPALAVRFIVSNNGDSPVTVTRFEMADNIKIVKNGCSYGTVLKSRAQRCEVVVDDPRGIARAASAAVEYSPGLYKIVGQPSAVVME